MNLQKRLGSSDGDAPRENCVLNYGLVAPDPTVVIAKPSHITCVGGTRIDVLWSSDFGRVERLALSAPNATTREAVSFYYYDTGELKAVEYDQDEVERYEYDQGFRIRHTALTSNQGNTGYLTLSDRASGTFPNCGGTWGGWSIPGFTSELTPEKRMDYVRIMPTTCPGVPRAAMSTTLSSGEIVETTLTYRDYVGLSPPFGEPETSRLTTRIETKCSLAGSACQSVKDASEWWEINTTTPIPHAAKHENALGNATTTSVSAQTWVSSSSVAIRYNQVDSSSCCERSSGTGQRLDESILEWAFYEGRNAHEPVLAVEKKPSFYAGSEVGIANRYHGKTKVAELREGLIIDINGDLQTRVVGTFYLKNRRCTDQGADEFGRIVEVHGPCFVNGIDSDDCDLETTDDPTPVVQFDFYPSELSSPNAGRLKTKRIFSRTENLNCDLADALETNYELYDASGHVLREVDPSGVITTRTFSGDKLLTESVGGRTTEYWYSPAQGGRISAIKDPAGVWTVYCHRSNSDESSCTAGSPAANLQWEAKISGGVPWGTGGWSIIEKTSYEYAAEPGAISGAGGGALVSTSTRKGALQRRHGSTYDPLGRVSNAFSQSLGTGAALFGSPKLYDGMGNLIAEGLPSQEAPPGCGGYAKPSPLCTRFEYDQLNRVTGVTKQSGVGTSPELLRIDYAYGATGAITSVTQQPGGEIVRYEVDDFGNVALVQGHWQTDGTRQAFDAAGHIRTRQSPLQRQNGTQVAFKYDAAGRPLTAEAGGVLLWAKGYDGQTANWANCPSNNISTLRGRLQWKDDSFGRTWYEYDSAGRVTAYRRVREGVGHCSASGTSSHEETPDTTFSYLADGRLFRMKYPHGLELEYTWGVDGRQNEIVAIAHNNNDSDGSNENGWMPLLSDITYDIDGSTQSYTMRNGESAVANYVINRRGGLVVTEDCSLPTDVTTDGSGRPDSVVVTREAEMGPENVISRRYSWDADKLATQATCVLDDDRSLNEFFTYDALTQLRSAILDGVGGPYQDLNYTYVNASDRDELNIGGSSYVANTYDQNRRLSRVHDEDVWKPIELTYDDDGRTSSISETISTLSSNLNVSSIVLTPDLGFGGVYREVETNGAFYRYLYDSEGRRRLKIDPEDRSTEFFYDGNFMIEDRGTMYGAMTSA